MAGVGKVRPSSAAVGNRSHRTGPIHCYGGFSSQGWECLRHQPDAAEGGTLVGAGCSSKAHCNSVPDTPAYRVDYGEHTVSLRLPEAAASLTTFRSSRAPLELLHKDLGLPLSSIRIPGQESLVHLGQICRSPSRRIAREGRGRRCRRRRHKRFENPLAIARSPRRTSTPSLQADLFP